MGLTEIHIILDRTIHGETEEYLVGQLEEELGGRDTCEIVLDIAECGDNRL